MMTTRTCARAREATLRFGDARSHAREWRQAAWLAAHPAQTVHTRRRECANTHPLLQHSGDTPRRDLACLTHAHESAGGARPNLPAGAEQTVDIRVRPIGAIRASRTRARGARLTGSTVVRGKPRPRAGWCAQVGFTQAACATRKWSCVSDRGDTPLWCRWGQSVH